MHSARRVAARVVIAIVILAMTAACTTTQGSDKTGGDTVVLTLATFEPKPNANGQNHGPEAFVQNLGKVSQGRLKVELKTEYGDGAADAESKLVRAIASGEVDGGWPSTRAFARAGVPGLEVVEAPLTITSYAAEKALVSGPVAGKLLARLDGSGVVGLGLTVGPLRRPFAANQPLLGPEDWKGITFRVFNSPVQADAVRALGATPADLSFSFIDQIKEGSLRGAEFDIAQYEHTGAGTEAGNVTANVVLWPKVFVLALSQKRLNALTPQQQTGCARRPPRPSRHRSTPPTTRPRPRGPSATGGPASGTPPPASSRACAPGSARCSTSSPPTRPAPSCSATSRRSPHSTPAPRRPTCRPTAPRASPTTGSPGQVPAATSALPDGVYRHQLTHDQVAAAGGDPGSGPAGTWTLRVRGGTFQLSCRPVEGAGVSCGDSGIDSDVIVEAGDLRGTGRTVDFVGDVERVSRLNGCKLPATNQGDHCGPPVTHRMTWALAGDQLSFTDFQEHPGEISEPQPLEWTGGPWRKIA